MSYRISTVSEMTGIPRNTLIAWERRYGLIQPERQPNGYRFYSEDDVSELLRVKNALNAGLKISEAVNVLKRNRSMSLAEVQQTQEAADEQIERLCAVAQKDLFEALVGYRGDEANAILNELLKVPFPMRLHKVYFPVLRAIGQGWQTGQLSVAQEHFATGILRSHLAAAFVSMDRKFLSAPHVVFATMPHDEHEVAALGLSVELSHMGYRVTYLGARLPAAELLAFCKQQSPTMVCISCLSPPPIDALAEYCSQLEGLAKRETRVVLGGACLLGIDYQFPDFIEFFPEWESFARKFERNEIMKNGSGGALHQVS